MKPPKPTFAEETILWRKGYRFIAGCDEVGRGAFAGPVVAAAVILPPEFPGMDEVHDSKLLTPKNRSKIATAILKYAVSFAIGEISVPIINRTGIGNATHMAFRKTLRLLTIPADYVLIDGFLLKRFPKSRQKAIIGGDRLSLSIAAASIIAKVYRDRRMEELAQRFFNYNLHQNKGYGTEEHRTLIGRYGLSRLHRTSFALERYVASPPASIEPHFVS